MSDEKIEPALGAEEWGGDEVVRLGTVEDWQWDRDGTVTLGTMLPQGDTNRLRVAMIAALNSTLPNGDRRKITRTWVNWLREEADVLKRGGAGAGALVATEIADALESYLPPE